MSAAEFPDAAVHAGYGLCKACYARRYRRRNGAVRGWRTRDEVLEEYDFLTTDTATTRRAIAAQFGMTLRALEHHLYEGRRAGDPRASRVVPR